MPYMDTKMAYITVLTFLIEIRNLFHLHLYTFTSFFSLKLFEILASNPFHYQQIRLAKEESSLKLIDSKLISYKKQSFYLKANISIRQM